ncbi:hypothetical protein DSO57_1013155 [Entomophthora muscae]|uniref:Uncharacterized protein n=1 Tax=Entomophthora muscae TaxID=34485 RepID=A0ACC2UFI4_9FUNG|nr:hypothetical protein DSO57_1013155 [Entomophthora muscae]
MAYQVTYHTATGRSPFRMVYGQQSSIPGLLATYQLDPGRSPNDHLRALTKGLITLCHEAYNTMGKNWCAAFACDIKHCPTLVSFEIGQHVLVSRACASGRPHKLIPIFSGPFVRVYAKFMKAAPIVDKEYPCPFSFLPTWAPLSKAMRSYITSADLAIISSI